MRCPEERFPVSGRTIQLGQVIKDGAGKKEIHRMREVVFRLEAERPGHLEARAETLPIRITAPTLEELQHEAREALIKHMGPAHCTVRVRVRRGPSAAGSSMLGQLCSGGSTSTRAAPSQRTSRSVAARNTLRSEPRPSTTVSTAKEA